MRLAAALLVGLSALFAATFAAAADCDPRATADTAQALNQTTGALRAVRVEEMDTDVPAPARLALSTYRTRLNAFLEAGMACAQPDVGAHEIERALTQLVGHPAANDASGYGGSLAFTVKAWGDGRLGVVATLGIQCGTDSALFVFSRAGGHWSEALKWEASPYADVGGAWEAFDYALSPPDARGQWFVAAKSIHPWCSSTWSQIRWAVIRPVPGQTHPRVLRSGDQSIWWGSDDLGAIVVTRESADFRWHAESIDGGVHNRVWIRRLAVGETSASRIQPVALSAEDFVDEWIITDWAQAAAWTASPALRRAHDRLKAGHDYEFTATRACQAPTIPVGQREVEVTQGERRRWYFRISGAEDFHMLAVAPRPTPFCRGPNLYKGPGAIAQ